MQKVEELIQQENVKEIALQFVDALGVLHTLWIPSEIFSKTAGYCSITLFIKPNSVADFDNKYQ